MTERWQQSDRIRSMEVNIVPADSSERGSGMVATLILGTAIGVLGLFVAQRYTINIKTAQNAADKINRSDLQVYISVGADCTQTVAAMPTKCNSGTSIALKRAVVGKPDLVQVPTVSKKPVSTTYTTLGKIKLKAYCTGAAKTFNVDYMLGSQSWKTLFDSPVTCP